MYWADMGVLLIFHYILFYSTLFYSILFFIHFPKHLFYVRLQRSWSLLFYKYYILFQKRFHIEYSLTYLLHLKVSVIYFFIIHF